MNEYAIILPSSFRDWLDYVLLNYQVLLPVVAVLVIFALLIAGLSNPPKV